jgi:hypothetical protein
LALPTHPRRQHAMGGHDHAPVAHGHRARDAARVDVIKMGDARVAPTGPSDGPVTWRRHRVTETIAHTPAAATRHGRT